MAYTYQDLEERIINGNKTIFNKKTGKGYPDPTALARDLGVNPQQIQWKNIKNDPNWSFQTLPQYVRQKGTSDVYDVSDKLPRYVDYGEAVKNNIWKKIKEDNYLYSPYKGVEVYVKNPSDEDYDQKFGKEGGYLYFGEPTKIFIKKGISYDQQKTIIAHELGHWLTRNWQREEFIKNLGYEDSNDNDVITLSEKMARDYESYKLGQLKDPLKAKKFKQLEHVNL